MDGSAISARSGITSDRHYQTSARTAERRWKEQMMSDLIDRQAAIDALNEVVKDHSITDFDASASILDLPPAHPEIIRCRNCKFASGDSRICMKFGHSPIGELDFCSFAERREVTT